MNRLGRQHYGRARHRRRKAPLMSRLFAPADLEAMRRVRGAFDPTRRLNPGKLIRRNEAMNLVPTLRVGNAKYGRSASQQRNMPTENPYETLLTPADAAASGGSRCATPRPRVARVPDRRRNDRGTECCRQPCQRMDKLSPQPPRPLSRHREKGDSPHLCEAPSGPSGKWGLVPLFPPGITLSNGQAESPDRLSGRRYDSHRRGRNDDRAN